MRSERPVLSLPWLWARALMFSQRERVPNECTVTGVETQPARLICSTSWSPHLFRIVFLDFIWGSGQAGFPFSRPEVSDESCRGRIPPALWLDLIGGGFAGARLSGRAAARARTSRQDLQLFVSPAVSHCG